MRKSTIAQNMLLELVNIFTEMGRKAFWASLNQKLIEERHSVISCTGDASTMVVSTVLNYACTGGNGKLTAADTNLLIMLKYIWNSIIGEIYKFWSYKESQSN